MRSANHALAFQKIQVSPDSRDRRFYQSRKLVEGRELDLLKVVCDTVLTLFGRHVSKEWNVLIDIAIKCLTVVHKMPIHFSDVERPTVATASRGGGTSGSPTGLCPPGQAVAAFGCVAKSARRECERATLSPDSRSCRNPVRAGTSTHRSQMAVSGRPVRSKRDSHVNRTAQPGNFQSAHPRPLPNAQPGRTGLHRWHCARIRTATPHFR